MQTARNIAPTETIIPARVVDVILDDSHPEFEKYGKWTSIGAIKYRVLNRDIDENNSQIRSLPTKRIEKKFEAFGWKVVVVLDGHNIADINKAISAAKEEQDLPVCVVCKTVKGKGVKEMETNIHSWHHGPPNKEQYEKFIEELDA